MKLNRIFVFLAILGGTFLTSILLVQAISGIVIVPPLDISLFSPYKIEATVSAPSTGTITGVSVEVRTINGDDPDNPTACWDYFIDGTCDSVPFTKTMTRKGETDVFESANIYPDNIYPEIYFTSSAVTWGNTPSNQIMNRNSYQLFNYSNPFSMVDGMSFFIELNAVPRATNSADLQIYLVSNTVSSTSPTFFNSDWRFSDQVELVGTISNNAVFHHTHSANSSHHLIALSTNSDGTVGSKNLDISDNFWIIVYNTSPNNARGWDLRYQSTAVSGCTDSGRWYQGSQAGWTTTQMSGCPDSHIHIARRITDINTTVQDGIKALVTATYSDEPTATSTQTIYFQPLPNLAPNPTSFIRPSSGDVYDSNFEISWNPATDPNGDDLVYNVYLLNETRTATTSLVAATSSTSFTLDISSISNGVYSLLGEVVEATTTPLSTQFLLNGDFTIAKTTTLYSLSAISLSSNNASTTLAKAGDTISLSFTATGTTTPLVILYAGGEEIASTTLSSGTSFNYGYTVGTDDEDGQASFVISADNLDQNYDETIGGSHVIVDTTSPETVSASPAAGTTYTSAQTVTLSSVGADYLRYTLDESAPSCSSGTLYSSALAVNEDATIKAIACDNVGNYSAVATFVYVINIAVDPEVSGGSAYTPPPATGSGQTEMTINMNQVGSLGSINNGGLNYLTYINSEASFNLNSGSGLGVNNYLLKIIGLDLYRNIVEFIINNQTGSFFLNLGEETRIDLNKDGLADLYVKFHDLLVNRVELTLKFLGSDSNTGTSDEWVSDLDTVAIMEAAREQVTQINKTLVNRLAGQILLQVESRGEAWYVEPVSESRYFMGRATDAFNLMRTFGLGVSNKNVSLFLEQGAPNRLAGRILLAVEANGEAYYVNPTNLKLYYLGRPADAFRIMRELSLGISNNNIYQIPVGE